MESPDDLILIVAIGSGIMLLLALAFVLFFSFSQSKLRKEQFKAQEARLQHQEQLLPKFILHSKTHWYLEHF